MILRRLTAMAALTAGATTLVAAPASAGMAGWEQDFGASADYVGMTVDGAVANVTITYTCSSTVSRATHLFVAVKQGGGVNTGDRSSSAYARSYYSTNWSVDEGPNALTCDGTEQTQTLVLKPDGWFQPERKAKLLHSGVAFVQICLFANIAENPDDPEGEPLGDFAFDYSMQSISA